MLTPLPKSSFRYFLLGPEDTSSVHPAKEQSRLCCQFKCCLLLCLFGALLLAFYAVSLGGDSTNGAFRRALFGQTNAEDVLFQLDETPIQNAKERPPKNDWTRMCRAQITKGELDRLFPPSVDKFVLASWEGLCGGLGNQMWRFASLYGIGKPYGRIPIFKEGQRCLSSQGPHESEGTDEIQRLFPVYAQRQNFINPREYKSKFLALKDFMVGDCCKYDDPQRVAFSRYKQKYVQIQGYYLQSYKFFEGHRQEIRQIFQFGPSICESVERYKNELFSNDSSHKMCVHSRIEDFKRLGMASSKQFTEMGIEFVFELLEKKHANISVVLMGADKDFLVKLNINKTLVRRVYLPRPQSRGEDLALGAVACDSLLITAPASTFSWWMGYLMPDGAPVFYDSRLQGTPYNRENFLPEWTPIRLQNGTMMLD